MSEVPPLTAKYMRMLGLKKYGLNIEDFDRMRAQQQNKCAICKETFGDGPRDIGVDHCHSTSRVRGLLCVKCNAGLGQFRDNTEFLLAAVAYLMSKIENEMTESENG